MIFIFQSVFTFSSYFCFFFQPIPPPVNSLTFHVCTSSKVYRRKCLICVFMFQHSRVWVCYWYTNEWFLRKVYTKHTLLKKERIYLHSTYMNTQNMGGFQSIYDASCVKRDTKINKQQNKKRMDEQIFSDDDSQCI